MTNTREQRAAAILAEMSERYPQLAQVEPAIQAAYQQMADTYRQGGKLLCAGNGGSAADCEHISSELMKAFHLARGLPDDFRASLAESCAQRGPYLADMLNGALPAISLASSVSLQTACTNDQDGVCFFAQGVYGLGREGDTLLLLSTSGNSENIILAAVCARAKGIPVVALTGADGGKLKAYADICICVPATRVDHVQELHLPVYHCLCAMLEARFFDGKD